MNRLIEALSKAYVGESQARMRYTEYAKTAKKEGYIQIQEVFLETADQEKTHGKNYFRMVQKVLKKIGESVSMINVNNVDIPLVSGTTVENLKASAAGEHHEHTELYPEIAKIAKEEGYPKIAAQILGIAKAEEHHEDRFKKLLEQLEKGSVFKKDGEVWWLCMECGYWHHGKEPPKMCPSCNHPSAYFKVMDEYY